MLRVELAGGGGPVSDSTPAPQILAAEGGYEYRLFETHSGTDMDGLCALVGRAWGRDYSEKSVLRFDAHYLRWLLGGDRWFGIEVRNASGLLVGCEVALERSLIWNQRRLRGYYATLLTVDPDHRGRGIAQGILGHLTAEALDRRQADVIVSTFDGGAAGRPTVERSIAGARGDLILRLTPPRAVWACTSDLRAIERYEPLHGLMRAALWPGVRHLLEFTPREDGRSLSVRPATLDEASEAVRSHHGAGFEPTGGLAARYAHRDDGQTGTFHFDFGRGATNHVAWHVATLTGPGLPDRLIGTIQFVLSDGASPRNQVRALRAVNRLLLGQGCLSTIIVDTGAVARPVLWCSGFRPSPRRVRFAVRGRSARLESFPKLTAPYAFDLL